MKPEKLPSPNHVALIHCPTSVFVGSCWHPPLGTPPPSWVMFGDIFLLLLHSTCRTSENLCHHPIMRVGIISPGDGSDEPNGFHLWQWYRTQNGSHADAHSALPSQKSSPKVTCRSGRDKSSGFLEPLRDFKLSIVSLRARPSRSGKRYYSLCF